MTAMMMTSRMPVPRLLTPFLMMILMLVAACKSPADASIVLNVDADSTVDKNAISLLRVTVDRVTRDYPVTVPLPGSLGIVTTKSGTLQFVVLGMDHQRTVGRWSGDLTVANGQFVSRDIVLSCEGEGCGVGHPPTYDGGDGGGTEGRVDGMEGSDSLQPLDAPDVGGAGETAADLPNPNGVDIGSDTGDVGSTDMFLGNGQDQALVIASGAMVSVNSYSALQFDAPTNSAMLRGDTTNGFSLGHLVMIWQTAVAASPWVSGAQEVVDLAATAVGQYELARLSGVDATANVLTLERPIANPQGYRAGGAQIIRVPEYTDVSIPATGGIVPGMGWNGAKGGVVAFLAMGVVNNAGSIRANYAGFRGGHKTMTGGPTGCVSLDGAPIDGFAMKGEGVVSSLYSPSFGGRGNLATGAGGGNCHNSGGGGGGHFGRGGIGGLSWTEDGSRAVGGLGGAPITYNPRLRLSFGGGGGAGDSNDVGQTDGGNGGGVVFIMAGSLAGSGILSADGQAGTSSNRDGAGGGGAGGLVLVRLKGASSCAALQAKGGAGGDMTPSPDAVGPGGGGAAGKVVLEPSSNTCPILVDPGRGGLQGGGSNYGATAGGS